jgi:signal transduction histidine kinase
VSRRLLASYLALTVVVLVALEVPLAIVNARTERQDLTAKVERDAYAAASLAEDTLQAGTDSAGLQKLAASYRAGTGGRIVIVNRNGRSIADSHPTVPGERAFRSRPEIAAALSGQTVAGIRTSTTLGGRLLYVAVPVASAGRVFGAVRITYPTSTLDHRINRYRAALAAVGLIVLATAAGVGLLLARSFSQPIRRLEAVAARVGGGELTARAPEDDGPPEVRRLAGELNRTTAKLGALLTSQEQFVADASHELRTPLTALQLRLENGDTNAALREAERLARLVDELLALARIDASTSVADDLDLGDVVARRVELWGPLAAEHGVHLRSSRDGAVVRAGAARVEQVLDNLLSNAIDASPRGGEITVAARGPELHVIDQGPGLTQEQRARAFDRFWRGGKGPGSGLGLAIAKRMVELDGGEIALRPGPTGGIDAAVRYPVNRTR